MSLLQGKVAIVTGGGSGLGNAFVRRFAAAGAQVIIADLREPAPGAIPSNIAQSVHFCRLDVADEDGWQSQMADAVSKWGQLDVLVNAAGVALDGDNLEDCTPEMWRKTMAVNLDGTFLGTRFAVAQMKRRGRGSIINIASIHGIVGDGGIFAHGVAAYSASKGGVRMLTKSTALHCAQSKNGIRCNVICPGYFETPMVLSYFDNLPNGAEVRARIAAAHPLGRLGRPDELAGIALYLASDASISVTGSEFVVDGGYLAA